MTSPAEKGSPSAQQQMGIVKNILQIPSAARTPLELARLILQSKFFVNW